MIFTSNIHERNKFAIFLFFFLVLVLAGFGINIAFLS